MNATNGATAALIPIFFAAPALIIVSLSITGTSIP
jgi:hypothetical protein